MAEKNSEQENRESHLKKINLQMFYSNSIKVIQEYKNSKINTSPLSASEILHLHGNIEVEEGEEAELHKHYTECKKNPGHSQFIPIKDFTIENLPEGYHDKDLYDLIKATAGLTVRIGIKMVSPDRPEFWPDTNVPYPCYDKRGNVFTRIGTGEISVLKFIEGQGYNVAGKINSGLTGEKYKSDCKTCPCNKCIISDTPNNIWWEIIVSTATHVVFDEIEANHTSCRLFYDSDDSSKVILDKFNFFVVNIEDDLCKIKYVTCEDFGKQLYEMYVHHLDLWKIVYSKYWNRDVIFIVSHPHGFSKQVSVGHLLDNHKFGEFNENIDLTKLTYTTATCPGSSGARVHCVGSVGGHVHTGNIVDSEHNYSSVSAFVRK